MIDIKTTTTTPKAHEAHRRSASSVLRSFMAVQVATGLGAMALNVLIARSMGPEGRGQMALFLQISVIAGVAVLAGVDRAYPAVVGDRPPLASAVRDLRLLAVPGFCLLLFACVAGSFFAATLQTSALIIAATGAIGIGSALGAMQRSAAAASGQSRPFLIASVAGQLALLTAGAVFLATEIKSPAIWLFAYACSLLLPFLVIPSRTTWNIPRERRTKESLKAVRALGLKIFPSTIATMVILRSDRFLLPVLSGFEQLGIYGTIATLTEIISLPVGAYVDSHIPQWRRQIADGSMKRWRALGACLIYGVIAAMLTTAVVETLFVPIFGTDYAPATTLCLPLALAAALLGVSRMGGGLALASGRSRAVVAIDTIAMSVSVGLYFLLIPGHGAMGAAIGSLIGYGSGALAAVLISAKGATTTNA